MTKEQSQKMKKELIFAEPAEVDLTLESEKVKRKMIVGCKVLYWDSTRKGLIVKFGKSLIGFIPEKHISIYPSKDYNGIPSEARFIVNNNIFAEVTDYLTNEDGKYNYSLSRSNVMRKVIEQIEPSQQIPCRITTITEKTIFLNVGFSGVNGRLTLPECSANYISKAKNLVLKVGEVISLEVKEICDDKVELSRKSMFPGYDPNMFNQGDIVEGRILSTLDQEVTDSECPYAYIIGINDKPNVKGLMNSEIELEEGQEIKCAVRKVTDRGIKLILLSI